MKWFEGVIEEAVTLSRKSNSVFVVFVEGEDEKSNRLLTLIEDDEVSQLLESKHFVAIRIKANSVSYQQFSAYYKDAPVPSIYFIGKTGTPLEIVVDSENTKDLVGKIGNILEKHGVAQEPIVNKASTSSENLINAEASTLVCENNVCKLPVVEKQENDAAAEGEKSAEEKVQHAKELLEMQRLVKEAEEKEKEKQQEIERRKVGQNVQNFKKWQQEQEFKQLMEQREREKKEQQEAKQRILAQIQQDKADRAARFQTNPAPSTSNQQTSPQPTRKPTANSNIARLQFRLPDGSSYTQDFPSTNKLQDVQTYIRNNLNLTFTNFTLSTTFPRREFNEQDFRSTLLELELVPNAVILILPLHHGTVSSNPGNFLAVMFWSLVSPLLSLFGYFRGLIYGKQHADDANGASNQNNKRPAEGKTEESKVPKRRPGDSTTVIRRQGNIHRLGDRTDSEDENNTWNGNSTQQM